MVRAFWEYYKKPIKNSVFNIGGGRYSNCSILEAIEYIEKKLQIKIKKKIINKPRIGDHQWYISDIRKFKKNYPNFSLKYNVPKILDEIIEAEI